MKFAVDRNSKPSSSSPVSVFFFFFIIISITVLFNISEAQTLDPVEAGALNSIFQQWKISAGSLWNISGEPCSGAAVDETGIEANPMFNPGIKCSCGTTNRSTCHITQLRVYAASIKGVIPKELAVLTSLTFL